MVTQEPISKTLLIYIGIVLLLSGSIAAKGEDMVILLFGGLAILLLEIIVFKQGSHKSNVLVQLTLSSALLLVGVIKLIESVGKHFTAQHLYLTMVLIGLILISIECLRRLPSDPAGVKEEA